MQRSLFLRLVIFCSCCEGIRKDFFLNASSLLRLAGRRKESERRDSLPTGDLTTENEEDSRRRPSFLRMVSLSKLRGDSLTNRSSQEDDEESLEEEPPVKRREPLSGTNVFLLLLRLYLFVLFMACTKCNCSQSGVSIFDP